MAKKLQKKQWTEQEYGSETSRPLGNYDRQTDRPTGRRMDRPGHEEVTIMKISVIAEKVRKSLPYSAASFRK